MVLSWGRACSNGPGVGLFKKPGDQNLAKDICLPKLPDVSQVTIVVFYSTFLSSTMNAYFDIIKGSWPKLSSFHHEKYKGKSKYICSMLFMLFSMSKL